MLEMPARRGAKYFVRYWTSDRPVLFPTPGHINAARDEAQNSCCNVTNILAWDTQSHHRVFFVSRVCD